MAELTDGDVQQVKTDFGIMHEIAHGDVNKVVDTENGPVRSVAKLIADNQALIDAQAPSLAQLATDAGAGMVGYLPGGPNSVATNVESKLRQFPSVLDKMTPAQIADALSGTPTMDHASAFQKAGDDYGYFEVPGFPYRFNVNTPVVYNNGAVRMFSRGPLGWINIKTTIKNGAVFLSNYGDFDADRIGFEADGTFDIVAPVANPFAFLKVAGAKKRLTATYCTFKNARTYGIIADGVEDVDVTGSKFIGGPSSFADGNVHFGISLLSAVRMKVRRNQFYPNESGGRVGCAVVASTQFSITDITGFAGIAPRYFDFSENVTILMHSYAIYGVLTRGSTIQRNLHLYCKDPICSIGTEGYDDDVRYPGAIIDSNIAYADPALAATSAQYALMLRHSNHVRITNNIFMNYGGGLQITPNSAKTASGGSASTAAIGRDITFEGNSVINYRTFGVQIARTSGDGTAFSKLSDIFIRKNTFRALANDADLSATGSVISAVFTSGAVIENFVVEGNVSNGAGSHLAVLTGIRNLIYRGNDWVNPGRNASGGTTGLLLTDVVGGVIADSRIEDTRTTKRMGVAINGSDSSKQLTVREMTLLGWVSAPMTQMTPTGHQNSFRSNRTGTDALEGVVTLAAAATTVVANNNAHAGAAYQRRIILEPINAAAAQLTAKRPYVSAQSNGVSFTLATADGSAAAGTEQFYYSIQG